LRRLRQVLTDAGFAPDDDAEGTAPQIKLRHCPFREIAEQHPEVVCSLHLGLMQGALAEVNAPVTAERLEPFVRPSLCVAHLSADRPSQRSTKAAATSRAVKRR
jgi:predicted ArsR family transcriptional regulator